MTAAARGRVGDDIARTGVAAVLIVAAIFLLVPLLVTILMAFDSRSYLGPLPPPGFSLRWFVACFSRQTLAVGLRTSLALGILATAISTSAGTAAAIALERGTFPGRTILSALFLSPLIVPPVVIGFALLLALSQAGILNGFVRLLCGHVVITLPYTIRAVSASLAGRDASLTEAALGLGASERQALWTITVPLARTGIMIGAIFAFAVSFDDVSVASFLTDPTTYTLPVALLSAMRANFDLTIAAAAVLLMVATVILIFILDRAVGFDRLVGQGMFRT